MISPADIADALGIPKPTAEQQDVIQNAPVGYPASVIAGAGSGKTELMSARVLWLVANNFMTPAQVLGLTFTRKAARELQARIMSRLNKLRETRFWPEQLGSDFDPPKIATYNSFANEVFRAVALNVGYESDVPLMGEAGSFLLAKRFVDSKAFDLVPSIADRDRRVDSLVELILELEAVMGEHEVSAKKFADFITQIQFRGSSLPKQAGGADFSQFAYMAEILAPLAESKDIATLAEGFREFKRESGLVDFSDQLRLAAEAVGHRPDLAHEISDRYRQVLLDEYQDTSSVQVRLLAALFGSRGVLAVGDPNQSIYGWRGAAAGTMESFGKRFGADPTAVFPLSTNWRSDRKILDVANVVASTLIGTSDSHTSSPLILRPSPKSNEGEVEVRMFEHELEEAESVARYFAEHMSPETTGAILFRKRKHMARFAAALDAQKLRYEISGLGGLLQVPEVADLVSALRVIADPESGVALIRLLSGPRWRIASTDVAALHDYARLIGKVRFSQQSPIPVTLIEALDELTRGNPIEGLKVSDLSRGRLIEAAHVFRELRQRVNLRLVEFARAVACELWLDIELMASSRPDPLGNLLAFFDLISEFEQSASESNLVGFLHWLDHAERKQRLEPPKSGAKNGVVQLVTVHSSKGLEWDLVAVPDLVEGEFPSEERSYRGWVAPGKLPYPLRLDRQSLPEFDWLSAESQKEFRDLFNRFKADVKNHLYQEQGRLAYVAFTRAKHSLLLTGAFWSAAAGVPREASRYLLLAATATANTELHEQVSGFSENPIQDLVNQLQWPQNFGSEVSPQASRLSAAVLAKLEISEQLDIAMAASELSTNRLQSRLVFPSRLSATAISSLVTDPLGFGNSLRRPLPSPFMESSYLGTEFHAALEKFFESGGDLTSEVMQPDALAQFAETGDKQSQLIRNFRESGFGDSAPKYVELPVQFGLGDLVVVCKLDAVFETANGLHVVDWKSGSPQSLDKMTIQLSLYRIALQRFFGVPIDDIQASLFFAATGQTVTPDSLLDENALVEKIENARKALLNQQSQAAHYPA